MNHNIDHAGRVHVIAVSPFESDHVALAHIFGHTAWKLESARSIREGFTRLRTAADTDGVAPIILCEETLFDGNWQDLLHKSQELSVPANLIVTTSQADNRLWAEVLNLGAYDVLQKPFRAQEVFRTIGLAWSHRRKPALRGMGQASTVTATAVA